MFACMLLMSTSAVVSNANAAVYYIDSKVRILKSKKTPQHGMMMRNVRKRYGRPLKKSRSIGRASSQKPRIRIWHYPYYRVYFENQQVIHTVITGFKNKKK